jgi:hypothetical protein
MVRRWCIALTGLALAAGTMAAAAPTVASAAVRPAQETTGPLVLGHPMIYRGVRDGTVETPNWSGYAVTGSTYSSVSASWVEPAGVCTKGSALAGFWVGLDGYGNTTVEQTGDAIECSGKTASYFAWYELYPNPPVDYSNPVKAGDDMSASVTTSGGKYTMTISDSTQDWTQTTTLTAEGANASAEAIAEAPCCNAEGDPLPLADFGTVHFTSVMVDGAKIGTLSPTKIVMATSTGTKKDAVSSLTGDEDFSATWKRK